MTTNYKGEKRNKKDLRELSPDMVIQIYTLAQDSKYQHGTGCECHNRKIDNCPGQGPIYSKIAKELNVDKHTVNSYLDDDYKKKYKHKIKTPEEMKRRKETKKRYQRSPLGKEANKRYKQSEKGRNKDKKYRQSQKGIENTAKWNFICNSSLVPSDITLKRLALAPHANKNIFNSMFGEDIFAE